MNWGEAKMLIIAMMEGVNPVTGEVLPEDHLLREETVRSALWEAVQSLGGLSEEPRTWQAEEIQHWTRKNGKLHAGRPWTAEDNALLLELSGKGMPEEEIARCMSRRVRGIRNQLEYLRQPREERSVVRPTRQGQSWSPQEDDTLRWMHESGQSLAQMAQELHRSEYAIECRLKKHGLIDYDPYRK